MTADVQDVHRAVQLLGRIVLENEAYFGELDSVVGDGDFGFSLARGFEIVVTLEPDGPDIGSYLKRIAMTVTSRVGGTSGPLWGTAFMRAAKVVAGAESVTDFDVVAMLRAGADGVAQRGGAQLGEKTLLDALVPATDAYEQAVADGRPALSAAALAARTAADATCALQARRGRASYTGLRSIGSPDAGAVAVAVILEQLDTRLSTDQRSQA